ncbi:MAG: hypothetical protein IPK78_10565 [Rhodospirillales bacterium]|nr:hypothetical protein [Rhodospirillales bacterium]
MMRDPAPIVALSISDGPDELARFGYLESHIHQMLTELLVALLRGGYRLGYGGDLRKAGYTRELFETLTEAYARGRLTEGIGRRSSTILNSRHGRTTSRRSWRYTWKRSARRRSPTFVSRPAVTWRYSRRMTACASSKALMAARRSTETSSSRGLV